MTVSIRRAGADDVDWLVELLNGEETEPYLSGARAFDREGIAADVARSEAEPERFGRFIVEVDLIQRGASVLLDDFMLATVD